MRLRFVLSALHAPSSPSLKTSFQKFSWPAAVAVFFLVLQALSLSAQAPTPVPVLTWRYDATHAGQNTKETLLTPQNVNPSSFGKLFSLAVDSNVLAQPLYVPGLQMSDGKTHNVLFVATENDSVYAFDADSNGGANSAPIWHATLLSTAYGASAGATAVPNQPDTGSWDVWPTVGITGTPVIDPTTNTLYVVSNTKENGNYFSRLHALNIITGKEQPGSPVNITATVSGTGNGSSNGQLTFSAVYTNQRPALTLYNGHVYIGYAAHGDQGPYHGWLFSYDAKTLQQTDVLCLTPNGYGAGLWGSGAGFPIDVNSGKMFLSTGNGTHSTFPPFNANSELSESVVAFTPTNGKLTPTDAFTTYNFQELNNHDWDQGSGGILMVPYDSGNGHMLITAGKEGRITLLNADNLGGYLAGASANTNALQDITGVVPQGVGFWSTPAYWNGHVYMWANKNVGMMFNLANGVMDASPESKTAVTSQFPEPTFSISSNGTQDGIAWAVRDDQFNSRGPAVLYAYDATDLTKVLYESDTNAQRDSAGPASKFTVPVVTNGKVYVAANGEVDVYGVFNGTPNAAAPVITPNGGSFSTSQNVEITTSTPGATVYYTLDGSTPTPSSTVYTGPISISTDTTVKAMVSAPGYVQSGVTTAVFSFTTQAPSVTFSPAGGTYVNAQTVTLSDTDANAKIYYTTDGSAPSGSSTLYAGPIAVKASETIKAIALDPALEDSNVVTQSYVIQNGGTSINFGMGFSSTAGLTLNGSAIANNDTRLQLTDGGLNEAGSVFWNAPIGVQAFTTSFDFQEAAAQANGFTFTIQNVGPTALGGNSAGLGYQNIQKSVAVKFNFYNYQGEGSDSTGLYTNGQPPVLPSIDMSGSGISLLSGDAIHAQITYDGTTLTLTLSDSVNNSTFTHSWPIDIPGTVGGNTAYVGFTGGSGGLSASQKILSWTYSTQAVPPVFSVAPGTYTDAQKVTLGSKTSDAVIYYTVDGTTPTANSTQYAGPIAVSTSETIKAIAISPTFGSSNVVSGAYTIQNGQAAGSFSLTAGDAGSVVAGSTATSTITVTPANGFTGTVALACAISNAPSGAANPPTCSVTQPAAITGTQSVPATVTINTQPATAPGSYTVHVTGSAAGMTAATDVNLTVTAPVSASFALSGTAVTIASPGTSASSVITITPSGGFTGNVALSCAVTGGPTGATAAPACTVAPAADVTGNQAVTTTLSITTQATTTPGTYTTTVTGTSGSLSETASITTTVGGVTTSPGFSLSGSSMGTITAGANGTSTITVTPAGGFTGNVALTCAVTSGPANATSAPTCSVTQPPAIDGTKAVTATLSVTTQAATKAMLHKLTPQLIGLGGGGTLAVLFFCFPVRRRKWQTMLCMMIFAIIAAAASGCGGAVITKSGGDISKPGNGATTPGAYTITVSGASGQLQATTTVSLTVQ